MIWLAWPRMLTADGITLAGFAGLRILLTLLGRPHFLPAKTRTHSMVEGWTKIWSRVDM